MQKKALKKILAVAADLEHFADALREAWTEALQGIPATEQEARDLGLCELIRAVENLSIENLDRLQAEFDRIEDMVKKMP